MLLTKCLNQWPGGIPSYINRHEQAEDDVKSATRAWRYFVRERWTDSIATDQQRRALIERWATADQELRDSYGFRAPEGEPAFEDPENERCLYGIDSRCDDVYICISEWTPEKQALLAKCILALFGWDGGYEHLAQNMSLLTPFEDNQGDILETFKFRQSVARPDFLDMHMAQDGTVLFSDDGPKLIIDDRTLETGLALWVQFATNGTRQRAYRSQMLTDDFPDLFRGVHLNQDPLEIAMIHMREREGEGYDDLEMILEDDPVNMLCPFADVYGVGTYSGENGHERARRDLCDGLDRYAPGFREAEELGNGLAIGYELERILADEGGPLRITERSFN